MGENSRVTNAEKSFNAVSNRPTAAITALAKKVSPYQNKLANNRAGAKIWLDRELQEVWSSFSQEDAADSSPLNHMFLVGYYCQRAALFTKNNEAGDVPVESEVSDEQ